MSKAKMSNLLALQKWEICNKLGERRLGELKTAAMRYDSPDTNLKNASKSILTDMTVIISEHIVRDSRKIQFWLGILN